MRATAPAVVILVLLAAILHAAWNALTKSLPDQLVAFGLIGVSSTVIAVGALPLTGIPAPTAVAFALGSAVIHVGYELALMQSYRFGAFGHTYPLARGTAPLLVAGGAWVFAHEHLGGLQLLGVITVTVGLTSVVLAGGRLRRADLAATVAAVLTGVAIAGYTLVDGLGVRHAANAFGYTALLFALQGPVLPVIAVAVRGRAALCPPARTATTGLGAGALSLLAYGIVIWAQTKAPLAVVSALRETSVVAGAVIGAVVFKEHLGWRRLPPAAAVLAGIILIAS